MHMMSILTPLVQCAMVLYVVVPIGANDVNRCPLNIARNLYLHTHAGRCYQFNLKDKRWWTSASSHCAHQGGTLITIERQDIQAFMEQILTNGTVDEHRLWIGATDAHIEQDWKWETGQNLSDDYTNWKEGSPSCQHHTIHCQEDCAFLYLEEGYKWDQTFCSVNAYQYGFVCQFVMLPEVTTVTNDLSPTDVPTTTISVSHAQDDTKVMLPEVTTVTNDLSPTDVPTTTISVSHAQDDTKDKINAWQIVSIILIVLLPVQVVLYKCLRRKRNKYRRPSVSNLSNEGNRANEDPFRCEKDPISVVPSAELQQTPSNSGDELTPLSIETDAISKEADAISQPVHHRNENIPLVQVHSVPDSAAPTKQTPSNSGDGLTPLLIKDGALSQPDADSGCSSSPSPPSPSLPASKETYISDEGSTETVPLSAYPRTNKMSSIPLAPGSPLMDMSNCNQPFVVTQPP